MKSGEAHHTIFLFFKLISLLQLNSPLPPWVPIGGLGIGLCSGSGNSGAVGRGGGDDSNNYNNEGKSTDPKTKTRGDGSSIMDPAANMGGESEAANPEGTENVVKGNNSNKKEGKGEVGVDESKEAGKETEEKGDAGDDANKVSGSRARGQDTNGRHAMVDIRPRGGAKGSFGRACP